VRGVSDKMLIQQLKELESDGVVIRTDYKEIPPRVDYALTPFGRSLAEALVPLSNWGAENMEEVARVFALNAMNGGGDSRTCGRCTSERCRSDPPCPA
jgi:DNA-binding HxlR family transcriptional regulator